MKTILLFCFMFCSVSMWSQLEINLEINFNAQFGQEYVPLEEFTKLTEGIGAWDDYYEVLELITPLVMPGFEDRPMNYIEVGSFGDLWIDYDNWPEDPYDLSFIAVAVEHYFLSPLNDENNTDQGHILFYQGDGVVIIEYQNVAFEEEMYSGDGSLVSRANLQIELHLDDLCVQFNYGPSNIGPVMEEYFSEYMIAGTGFGWYYEEFIDNNWEEDFLTLFGIVSGDPNNPQFHQFWIEEEFDDEDVEFLHSYPEEGTVYRFCYTETTSTRELLTDIDDWSLYPNPATDQITIVFSEVGATATNDYRIQLMDVYGKIVLEKEIGHNQSISIESLPAGLYFASLKGGNSNRIQKVVKK